MREYFQKKSKRQIFLMVTCSHKIPGEFEVEKQPTLMIIVSKNFPGRTEHKKGH